MPKLKFTDIAVKSLPTPASGQVDYWDTLLSGFGLRIGISGKKTWVVSVRVAREGKWQPPRRIALGHYPAVGLSDAREKAKLAMQLASEGKDPRGVALVDRQKVLDDSLKTFGIARKRFLETKTAAGLKEATLYDYSLALNSKDLADWEHTSVSTITKANVKEVTGKVSARGAPVMANRLQDVLSSFFSWAASEDLVSVSPVAGIEKRHRETSRDRTPSSAELVEIWGAAEMLGWPFGPAIKLLILLAQRENETGRMRWSELDLHGGTWTLPGERTKNGQPFDIHLAPAVLAILTALPRMVDKEGREVDLVFTTTGTTPISGWSKAKSRLDAAIFRRRQEAASFAGQDPEAVKPMTAWVFHDLRRAFATGCGDMGVAEHVADRCLNHVAKKKGGVARVYNRALYAAERQAAMALWARHVAGLLGGATGRAAGQPEDVTAPAAE